MNQPYELVFWGAALVRAYPFPKHARYHATFDEAREASMYVYEQLEEMGVSTAAHPGIVFGPGLGRDGVRV